jgi:hypothetical protein
MQMTLAYVGRRTGNLTIINRWSRARRLSLALERYRGSRNRPNRQDWHRHLESRHSIVHGHNTQRPAVAPLPSLRQQQQQTTTKSPEPHFGRSWCWHHCPKVLSILPRLSGYRIIEWVSTAVTTMPPTHQRFRPRMFPESKSSFVFIENYRDGIIFVERSV